MRAVAQPGDHLEAGEFRQSEVEQDQKWDRVTGAIGILPLAGEVLDGRLSVSHFNQLIGNVRIAEGAAEQQNVRLVILNQKNGGVPRSKGVNIFVQTHSDSDTEYFL